MFSALSKVKDAAIERALAAALRPRLQRYGDLRSLNLDTSKRVLRGEIQLLGEAEPVVISQAHYRVESQGGDTYAVFSGIKISRPWAQNLLEDHFAEIRVKLPEFARKLIS